MTRRRRTRAVFAAHLAVGLLVFAWIWRRHGDAGVTLLARAPQVGFLAASFALGGVSFVLFAGRWQRLVMATTRDVALGALLWCRAAGHTLSVLLPNGKLVAEPLRMVFAVREGVPVAVALATVAIDRVLEMGASAPFAWTYMTWLFAAGVEAADRALAIVAIGTVALAGTVWVVVRRLRDGQGVVSAFARVARLDRLPIVRDRLHVLDDADALSRRLVAQRGHLLRLFLLGIAANVANFFECQCLLAAFGLPAGAFYVGAAIVAGELARTAPVPVSLGALEAAEVWLFTALGFSPDVGMAVGLAMRLRETFWLLPGGVYLLLGGWRTMRDEAAALAAS